MTIELIWYTRKIKHEKNALMEVETRTRDMWKAISKMTHKSYFINNDLKSKCIKHSKRQRLVD